MKNYFYSSTFKISNSAIELLKNGKVLKKNETPSQMIDRFIMEIAKIENEFQTNVQERNQFISMLGEFIDNYKIIFSTPIFTNAGSNNKPLSACALPVLNLNGNISKIKEVVDKYHQEAMGTGFNFDDLDNPVYMLNFLNDVAINGANSGLENRPVGNIGILSVDHPMIKEFIKAKIGINQNHKFNIAINIDKVFMDAIKKKSKYQLRNGKRIYAEEIFDLIVNSVYISGSPGLIFMDKMNRDNPIPSMGPYSGVAPCAEVGLIPGESCQFGYLNLGAFISNKKMDIDNLIKAVKILVRALDDTIEISIKNFSIKRSSEIMKAKRKISIGVCGLADALVKLDLAYDSKIGRIFCRDVITLINYISKETSSKLAKNRGSFLAFSQSRYIDTPGFLETKYGELETKYVTKKDWLLLSKSIKNSKNLRNSTTISLPPTGRSSLIINASTGVEPFFNLNNHNLLLIEKFKEFNLDIDDIIKLCNKNNSCQDMPIPRKIKSIFKTATEISPQDHLAMINEIQPCIDESISKTINLPKQTTIDEVKKIYIDSYESNVKGITVYIDGSINLQPITLSKE